MHWPTASLKASPITWGTPYKPVIVICWTHPSCFLIPPKLYTNETLFPLHIPIACMSASLFASASWSLLMQIYYVGSSPYQCFYMLPSKVIFPSSYFHRRLETTSLLRWWGLFTTVTLSQIDNVCVRVCIHMHTVSLCIFYICITGYSLLVDIITKTML